MFSILSSDYSPLWIFVCLMFAGAISSLLYFHNKKLSELGKIKIRILFALRFCSTFLIAVLLIGLFVKTITDRSEKPVLVVAFDNSQSMILRGDFAKDSLKTFSESVNVFVNKLNEKYNVKTFTFGESVNKNLNLSFDEKYTDFSKLFDYINNGFYNTGLKKIVVISDGICNKGENPIYSVEKLNSKIYTICTGDSTDYCDLYLSKIIYNETVFYGNEFPVEITVGSRQFKDKSATVEIVENQKVIFSKQIKFSSDGASAQVSAMLKADKKGIKQYMVKIVPDKKELSVYNNYRTIAIDVVDDKYKILLLSQGPVPDMAAVGSSLVQNPGFEVTTAEVSSFKSKVSDFDLIFSFNLPANNQKASAIFSAIKSYNIPVLYVISSGTDIELFNSLKTCVRVLNFKGLHEDAISVVNYDFSLFNFENGTLDFFKDVPPLNVPFANYEIANGSQVLFKQSIKGVSTSKPLIIFSGDLVSKHGVICGDGLWRWRFDNYKRFSNFENFDRFILKIASYLLSGNDKKLFDVQSRKVFFDNENVFFNAKLLSEDFQPITYANIKLEIKSPDNRIFKYDFAHAGDGYFVRCNKFPSGFYTYTAYVNYKGQKYSESGSFSVDEVKIEADNLTADKNLMKRLSLISGGNSICQTQLQQLQQQLLDDDSAKPVVYSDISVSDLSDMKIPFVIIIVLLAAEWFLRKFNGLL